MDQFNASSMKTFVEAINIDILRTENQFWDPFLLKFVKNHNLLTFVEAIDIDILGTEN